MTGIAVAPTATIAKKIAAAESDFGSHGEMP
jgi:hypothetical protein